MCRDMARKWSLWIFRSYTTICREGMRKTTKPAVKTANQQDKIQTFCVPKTLRTLPRHLLLLLTGERTGSLDRNKTSGNTSEEVVNFNFLVSYNSCYRIKSRCWMMRQNELPTGNPVAITKHEHVIGWTAVCHLASFLAGDTPCSCAHSYCCWACWRSHSPRHLSSFGVERPCCCAPLSPC
jgi:hypothetical protein